MPKTLGIPCLLFASGILGKPISNPSFPSTVCPSGARAHCGVRKMGSHGNASLPYSRPVASLKSCGTGVVVHIAGGSGLGPRQRGGGGGGRGLWAPKNVCVICCQPLVHHDPLGMWGECGQSMLFLKSIQRPGMFCGICQCGLQLMLKVCVSQTKYPWRALCGSLLPRGDPWVPLNHLSSVACEKGDGVWVASQL